MNLKIKGFQKTSLIDYPGKVCSVVFLAGCNFRCPFCQNPDIVIGYDKLKDISPEKIFDYIQKKRKWIDGVCITGGEPTIYPGLPAFMQKIKKRGFFVKLDTNGSNPRMLDYLFRNCLVDYVSMDIKAPLENYHIVAATKVKTHDIQKSIDLIMKSGLEYEFRTTVVPEFFSMKDALTIGKWLNRTKKYALQQFRPTITLDKSYQNKKPYSEKELLEFKKIMKPFFTFVEIRT